MTRTKQRLLSLTLVAAMFFALAIPASARASAYINTVVITTKSLGNGKILIRVDVAATTKMNEVGAMQIIVNKKGEDGKYSPVYTYTKEKYNLMAKNCTYYAVELTYQGVSGKEYYITAQCYAKNASGSGTTWAGSNAVRA